MTGSAAVPIVSVVIPLYNAGDVIRETIESVLRQTYTDYEIIVVDDGSTDGSEEVVRTFGRRIRYLRQDNRGVARARNRGIAESGGTYIALLDHDDLWDPAKLQQQVTRLDHDPTIGMVITDVAHIDRDGRPMGIVGAGWQPHHTFARLFVQGFVPTPSAAMIRKSVLEAVGGFDERFDSAGMDDHEFWTRIAARSRIVCLPAPLTYHRNRESKPPDIALSHRSLLIDTLLARCGQDENKRRYLIRERASYLADQGKQLVKTGHRRQGRSYLVQGLALSVNDARSWKTAWRCLSRLARSYV